MTEHHTCGRRHDFLAFQGEHHNQDAWRDPRQPGLPQTCSYCGSISQEEFFRLVESGADVGPTDKNYKVYVRYPNPHPDHQRIVSAINFEPDEAARSQWVKINRRVRKDLKRDGWGDRGNTTYVQYGSDREHQVKFYFQHLDDAGQQRFIDLYNTKRMKLGFPGRFYTRPYFTRYAAEGE